MRATTYRQLDDGIVQVVELGQGPLIVEPLKHWDGRTYSAFKNEAPCFVEDERGAWRLISGVPQAGCYTVIE